MSEEEQVFWVLKSLILKSWKEDCGPCCSLNTALRRLQNTQLQWLDDELLLYSFRYVCLSLWSSCEVWRCCVFLLWPLHCFHSLCTCCCPAESIRPSVWGFSCPSQAESTARSFHSLPLRCHLKSVSLCHYAVCVTDSVFNLEKMFPDVIWSCCCFSFFL